MLYVFIANFLSWLHCLDWQLSKEFKGHSTNRNLMTFDLLSVNLVGYGHENQSIWNKYIWQNLSALKWRMICGITLIIVDSIDVFLVVPAATEKLLLCIQWKVLKLPYGTNFLIISTISELPWGNFHNFLPTCCFTYIWSFGRFSRKLLILLKI